LLEPRFDQQVIAMPNTGLTEEKAEAIARWLLEPSLGETIELRVKTVLPDSVEKQIREGIPANELQNYVLIFAIGSILGAAGGIVLALLLARRKRARADRAGGARP
jgi:uncharacterized membrane protein YheB (UPF0754 family)